LKTKVKNFLLDSLNGMTFGIFGTIVIGAIFQTIGIIFGIDILVYRVAPILTQLLGAGIGLSIGLALKADGLKLIMLTVSGGIATMLKIDFNIPGFYNPNLIPNNPITAYIVVVLVYLTLTLIFNKKTVYDLFFIPIVGVLSAVLFSFIVSWPIDKLMELIYQTINLFMNLEPYLTSAFISLIFGILLTLPFISSAGVAIAVFTVPFLANEQTAIIAMLAALIGCTTQMVGFSVQTLRKNNVGSIFTIGLASSMFHFKNILKKPTTWMPTLIVSFVLAPLSYLVFDKYSWFINSIPNDHSFSAVWAGMGSSGLVGQLQVLSIANFSLMSWIFTISVIIMSGLLVYLLDVLFIKFNWYHEDDLILKSDI